MDDALLDRRVRLEAFRFLEAETAIHGEVVLRDELGEPIEAGSSVDLESLVNIVDVQDEQEMHACWSYRYFSGGRILPRAVRQVEGGRG